MAPTWHCKRCPLCPVQFAVIPSWGIPSVSSLTLALSRNPRLFFSKCQERLKERCATQIVVRILENSGHWHASTNSISLVGNYESFTTIIAILTHFTSKMDVKHFGNLLITKIRSRRAVKRPLQVSPSSRCPSGGRFAPYLGSKRSVAGQVPLFERTGTWVNGVQPVTCVLLPGPNWCVPNSSTRCQAFASSSSAILLSEQVPSGCCAPWDGRPSFGGGGGWPGRPLGVLVDVVRAR